MAIDEKMTYKEWLCWHAEDLKWIVEMAKNGIRMTPNAGDHPANLVLYMLDCDVQRALSSSTTAQKHE